MRLRLLLLVLLAGLPLAAARADSAVGVTPDGSAAGLSAPANASSLGPATTSGNTGGSSADSSTLQPAGTSPLQSTTNDSGGLSAPTGGNALQAPATGNDNLQVVMGDADGATHNVAGSPSGPWDIVWWSLLIGALVAVGSLLWRKRRQLRFSLTGPGATSGPDPAGAPEPSPIDGTSSQRLRITIDRPAAKVFDFVLDPKNTPKWISFIKSEATNEWPPKLGTIYTNTDATGDEREYKLTEFKPKESFVLSKLSNTYHVRYTITELEDGHAELEYYEWMDEGNLAQPFTSEELKALKSVMEKPESKAGDKKSHTNDQHNSTHSHN